MIKEKIWIVNKNISAEYKNISAENIKLFIQGIIIK